MERFSDEAIVIVKLVSIVFNIVENKFKYPVSFLYDNEFPPNVGHIHSIFQWI